MSKGKTIAAYLAGFLAVIAADQGFKFFITQRIPLNAGMDSGNLALLPGVIHLTHIHNAGAAFGMLQGQRGLFLLLLGAFIALVVWALATNQLKDSFSRALAVLAAAGAVSNGIDRVMHGYVVDMFELEFVRFAVFNVADAVMNVCAALFIIHMLRHWKDGIF